MFGLLVNIQPSRNNNCECQHETHVETKIQHKTYIQGSNQYHNQGYGNMNYTNYSQHQNNQPPQQHQSYSSEKSFSLTNILTGIIVVLLGFLLYNAIFTNGETHGKNQELERSNEFNKGRATRDAFYIPK